MGRKKNIPDGWLDYYPIKDAIHEARIIPIKCPLPRSRFEGSLFDARWTPGDVMNAIPNLGLIVDITNKEPAYYDVNEFRQNGIEHVKIPCVGHHVPRDDIFYRFCEVLDTFTRQNSRNNNIVALHCTHGVNRTGYMICRYLVERLNYTARTALQIFGSQRGHPVERENYIEDLIRISESIESSR
ncbi:hypothetical protein CDAR_453911 [Caerostris darwini]|uniref:RNA/RNP complex-1-interacting phosphatase n=1 Tax=Caerostris darwini TaxID=1538125 RepID=A0AAV4X1P6_9ARAC|nr:hypothetical protein CDAR_453911 [Caerostris darwini]